MSCAWDVGEFVPTRVMIGRIDGMARTIDTFFSIMRDPFTRTSFVAACIVNIGLWVTTALSIDPGTEFIPYHYTIYFGTDLFGPWYALFAYAGFGTAILLVNTLLAAFLFRRQWRLASITLCGTSVLQVFLAVGLTAAISQLT